MNQRNTSRVKRVYALVSSDIQKIYVGRWICKLAGSFLRSMNKGKEKFLSNKYDEYLCLSENVFVFVLSECTCVFVFG